MGFTVSNKWPTEQINIKMAILFHAIIIKMTRIPSHTAILPLKCILWNQKNKTEHSKTCKQNRQNHIKQSREIQDHDSRPLTILKSSIRLRCRDSPNHKFIALGFARFFKYYQSFIVVLVWFFISTSLVCFLISLWF